MQGEAEGEDLPIGAHIDTRGGTVEVVFLGLGGLTTRTMVLLIPREPMRERKKMIKKLRKKCNKRGAEMMRGRRRGRVAIAKTRAMEGRVVTRMGSVVKSTIAMGRQRR